MPIGATIGSAVIGAGSSMYSSNQQAKAAKSAAEGQQAASLEAGRLQSEATAKAAQLQSDATNRGLDLQQKNFDTIQSNNQPFRNAGASALEELTRQLQTQPQYAAFNFAPAPDYGKLDVSADAYKESPGLTSSLSRGIADLNSKFAAKGLIGSGAAAKAIADYATGTRMNDYNTWAAQQTNQFNQDRNFLQSDYQNNRNFAYQNYSDTTNRDIAQRSSLLQSLYSIAGLGVNATNGVNAAGTATANNQADLLTSGARGQGDLLTGNAQNQSGLLTSNATNQGQAKVAQSNADATGLNTAAGFLTSALGKIGTSYKGASQPATAPSPDLQTHYTFK